VSADIKVGDVVVITRPTTCCAFDELIGTVFTVSGIETVSGFCNVCHNYIHQQSGAQFDGGYVQVSRLKKLDAPRLETETDSEVRVREEVKA